MRSLSVPFRLLRLAGLALLIQTFPYAVSHADADETLHMASADILGFIFLHEAGHMLIHQFDLPVIGLEEDAADQFAMYVFDSVADKDSISPLLRVAQYSQRDWNLIDPSRKSSHEIFWDDHSLAIERAAHLICFLYGSDPERHKDLLKLEFGKRHTTDACKADYADVVEGWDKVLAPHYIDKSSGAKPNGRLHVEYRNSATPRYVDVKNALIKSGYLDQLADLVSGAVNLPQDIEVIAEECGEVNAFYDGDTGRIYLCYELVEDVLTAAKDIR